ncbi:MULTISPECIES: GTP-binding protein [Myxococcus]|uniref:GTP-binding protein n=1 Tax=Myxococcus xanthus TaxID=34 RepID=A0AAE6FYT3_MYXXA|nr:MULTISPECIES: GTP-binding protein [Myxococcus]QDE67828.1 GTP-binding protein [Myxococcus xanthus]QDE75105.1 GTP-binding protein [Myxococcus xanthus]QDE82378.1 GTP-binding protein [Myxococcus xanthus]QDE96677.1 GTP-binding protein [Myxococcus xanthus]QDF04175.1 GTP-binding protein [Myxococcus xanthus]
MSSVNLMAREVAAKIVFYGPGLSGKTTSLRKIYETVRPAHRGEMMSIATEGDRTLFFDFLPVKVERVGDCSVRLALYTVPGQVFYNATRKLVLQGADGVVFVADSQPEAMDANRESLANLEENLFEHGIRLDRFPLVMQWNKRDLDGVLPVEVLRKELNPRGVPELETSAANGRGVLDTLKAITRLVIKDLRAKRIVPPPRPTAGAQPAGLEAQLTQHLQHRQQPGTIAPAPQPMQGGGPVPRVAPVAVVPPPRVEPAPIPAPQPGPKLLGAASALAPGDMFDHARAAEAAFMTGDYTTCVTACTDAIRRALAFAGEGSLGQQAFLLRVDGADLLRLQGLATQQHLRVDDAAFSLYVMMQVFIRLNAVGLPNGE